MRNVIASDGMVPINPNVRLHLVLVGGDQAADDVVRGLAAALLEEVLEQLAARSSRPVTVLSIRPR